MIKKNLIVKLMILVAIFYFINLNLIKYKKKFIFYLDNKYKL
jgi:hypothetical protein